MHLHFFPASASVRSLVYGYCWAERQAEPGSAATIERMFPNASVSLQLTLRGQVALGTCAGQDPLPAAFLWGPTTQPSDLQLCGEVQHLSIMLRPTGWFRLSQGGMGRLCDCVVPLANLPEPWPDLWQVAADPGRSVTERIACCEAFLAAQKVPSEHNLPLSEAFLDDLMQRPEHCEGIGDYADQLHVSARSLRRHFRQAIGLSPKLFLRIRRFHQMIHLMRNTPGLSTMDMVFLGGYHDQAHLAKEFKEFAGLSLRTYLQGDYAWATRSVLAVPMPQVRS